MHHALLISEVFRDICTTLDASSLSAVARSCRAFHDVALDELWRDLYSIYPLVHFLTPPDGHTCLSLHQWTTLCRYSARTRSLYICMIDDLPYFDRFPCLANCPHPDVFFPNLHTLAWYPDSHLAMLPLFRLLCGPALTSLSAEFATDPTSVAMLAALGDICPNMTDISISASSATPNEDLAIALSTSIPRWTRLERVSCDDLTAPAMEHLSQLNNLESLTVCASRRMFSFPSSELSFPRLQHLHLYTGVLSTITTCLAGLQLSLDEFRLDLFDAEQVSSDTSCLRDALTAFASACAHACLTRFYLCVIHPHFPSPNALATIHDLRPLLSFAHLRVASLEGLSTFSFDDDAIAALAAAWPEMEELALSTYVDHPTASLPTVHALVRLVRACPKLRSLALVVDTTTLVAPAYAPILRTLGHDVRSDVLEELCVGNAPISEPVAVARMLRRLYPRLKQVDLSVWNKEPLDRLPRRDRYEVGWGIVNMELHQQREGTVKPLFMSNAASFNTNIGANSGTRVYLSR